MMTRDHHAIPNLIIHTHECQIYLRLINAQNISLISILYAVEFPPSSSSGSRKKGTRQISPLIYSDWLVFQFGKGGKNKSETNFTFSDADVTSKSLHYHIKIT